MPEFFSKIVANVGASSKAVVEKAKSKSAINNFENERKQLISQLGQVVYDTYTTTGQIPVEPGGQVLNLISEITERLQLIIQQEEHLALIEAEVSMAASGTKNIAGTACPCGHKNSAEAKFCVGCGKQL